jgi:hypothetical protein
VTRYLSRIGGTGTGAGAGIRPRVRSRFEPAPLAPIDGLGPAISIAPPQPDRDLDAPAAGEDRSATIAERQPAAAPAPALDGGERPGRDRQADQSGRGTTAPTHPTLTTRQIAAAQPRRPPISTDPGLSPQPDPDPRPEREPRRANQQAGGTDGRRTTPAQPPTAVSRAHADTPADAPQPPTHSLQAPRTDADATAGQRGAQSASPAARHAAEPSDGRASQSTRDPEPRRDHGSVTGTPTASRAGSDESSAPLVPGAPISAQARPRAPLSAPVPLPPRPGDIEAPAPIQVTVSIDRVEVRPPVAPAAPAPPTQRPVRRRPQSLDEYMRTRTDRRIG